MNKYHPIVYYKDCRVMKEVADESVHLIVTSPPYNVGMNYGKYKDNLPEREYGSFMQDVLKECYRVTVKGGRIALVVGNCVRVNSSSRFVEPLFFQWLRKTGWEPREHITIVHNKESIVRKGKVVRRNRNENSEDSVRNRHISPLNPILRIFTDSILVAHKITTILHGKEYDKEFLGQNSNIIMNNYWRIPNASTKYHPSPFHVEIPKRLIALYSYKGQTILDCFCGIGTTLVAAKNLQRYSIGYEIDERYKAIMDKRTRQQSLHSH